jgi:hypothetical protein
MVNSHKKIHQLILNGDRAVELLEEICPPACYNIKAVAEDSTKSNFMVVNNSCYHMGHKAAVSRSVATTLQSPLVLVEKFTNLDVLLPLLL